MTKSVLLGVLLSLVGCKTSGQRMETKPVDAPLNDITYFEIVSKDVETTRDSFSQTYGWTFEAMGPELGSAFVAKLPGGGRCGIRAPLRPDEDPIVRIYIRVADVAKATKLAEQSGAKIALPPTEIPGHGTIAIYLLGGIEQGIWQLP